MALLDLAGLDWPVPDFSTLCRRQKTLTPLLLRPGLPLTVCSDVSVRDRAGVLPRTKMPLWAKKLDRRAGSEDLCARKHSTGGMSDKGTLNEPHRCRRADFLDLLCRRQCRCRARALDGPWQCCCVLRDRSFGDTGQGKKFLLLEFFARPRNSLSISLI